MEKIITSLDSRSDGNIIEGRVGTEEVISIKVAVKHSAGQRGAHQGMHLNVHAGDSGLEVTV